MPHRRRMMYSLFAANPICAPENTQRKRCIVCCPAIKFTARRQHARLMTSYSLIKCAPAPIVGAASCERASVRPSRARQDAACSSPWAFSASLGGCRRRCVRAAKRAPPACLASARFRTRGRETARACQCQICNFYSPIGGLLAPEGTFFGLCLTLPAWDALFQQDGNQSHRALWDCKNITHRQKVSTRRSFF